MTGFAFTSRSKPHGWQLTPHAEIGYNYSAHECPQTFQWRVNPFIMLDWANNWQNHYRETGNGPFNSGQKSHHSSLLRTDAGIRFYESFLFRTWSLTLQELGSYVNIQSYGAGKVTSFLVGSPGLFTVETLKSAQNLGVIQFAMIFTPVRWCYPIAAIFYQGEFGSKFQSHQANLEFSWRF